MNLMVAVKVARVAVRQAALAHAMMIAPEVAPDSAKAQDVSVGNSTLNSKGVMNPLSLDSSLL